MRLLRLIDPHLVLLVSHDLNYIALYCGTNTGLGTVGLHTTKCTGCKSSLTNSMKFLTNSLL